ncbi:hypothetical protein OH76DRAFT_541862 [Lentinus brumalis]|uniref:DUF1917-domain-containing protein n=1 Tax=Lentinus brumalis TaxID=2498619 RepID=A0A371D9M6_9APHY|nr:hypothetical protein OH76DRAFT_541862 [Polyporus brumalis]
MYFQSLDEDSIPESYTYKWTPKSATTLQEFLGKWLWVAKAEQEVSQSEKGAEAAIEEANKYLADVTECVQKIQTDDSIPVRANKKKGLKSKKELREEVQHEATGKLKEISVKHGYVSGKWLIFASPDKVDMIWNSIANSLVSGPLSATSAFLAKVATSPQNDTSNYSHLICVYMPDVYDQDKVTEVMKVLLRNHGQSLMGVKTNLYTSIGLDSKHPSGISSTVWKNTALMKDSEIKQLKDEYYAELSSSKTAAVEEATAKTVTAGVTANPKAKPKLKKKAGADDPFASDDEAGKEDEGDKAEKPAAASKAKAKKPAPKKKAAADDFASDDDAGDDDEGEEARKEEVKAKKKAAPRKRKSVDSDEEDSDDVPKKKRGRA